MSAPTLVTSGATAWNSSTTPKNTSALSVQAGDIIVIIAMAEGHTVTLGTPSDGVNTYTLRQSDNTTNFGAIYVWTAPVASTGTATPSVANSGSAIQWGLNWYVYRGSAGVGNSAKAQGTTGTASVSVTASAANSAMINALTDWNAVATTGKTWRTVNSITPTSGNGLEKVATQTGTSYTVYAAVWNDVGATGAKTLGMTAPAGTKWNSIGIEIKGSATTTVNGTLDAPFVFGTSTTGTVRHLGTLAAAWVFGPALTGKVTHTGTLPRSIVFGTSITGQEPTTPGTLDRSTVFTTSITGKVTHQGTLSLAETFNRTITGKVAHHDATLATPFVFNTSIAGSAAGPFTPTYDIPRTRISSRLLIDEARNAQLDLDDWVGQRQATFVFRRVDGVTNEPLGRVYPLRTPTPTLSHDTTRTIKRSLSISLGAAESQLINPLTERLEVAMSIRGVEYPLGRYVYNDASRQRFTTSKLASLSLYDEMFLIDQQIEKTFSASRLVSTTLVLNTLLAEFKIDKFIETSPFLANGVWNIGTNRGQILDAIALQGDYFSPWMGNDGGFHMKRTVDPEIVVPTFNWDESNVVFLGSVVESDNLLNAPNRFLVISNSGDADAEPIVGQFDVPSSAPHSIDNRGFVILDTRDLQSASTSQAFAMARTLALTNTIVEQREIATPPDPRHDAYDVVHWDGENWLEVAWSMTLIEGGSMSHVLQKLYS